VTSFVPIGLRSEYVLRILENAQLPQELFDRLKVVASWPLMVDTSVSNAALVATLDPEYGGPPPPSEGCTISEEATWLCQRGSTVGFSIAFWFGIAEIVDGLASLVRDGSGVYRLATKPSPDVIYPILKELQSLFWCSIAWVEDDRGTAIAACLPGFDGEGLLVGEHPP
jgi:hypothetical protein